MISPYEFPLTPQPPEWGVVWDALAARFTWLRAMAGVPQEPAHHGEGDVFVHTRMVAETLAAMPAWRALPPDERSLLFAAALLHDVAKPACTRTELDGSITSRGHARAGATMTHALLWNGNGLATPPPFAWRDAVARLVRHHGLPLWFWDKDDPPRAVIAAIMVTRLDHLALLAEADARGRICTDQAGLLERIDLFRAFAHEQQCFATPRIFASDHSRFVYFQRHNPDPTYTAFDDTRCEVIIMAGLPGAGKDTWVRTHRADWPVVSLDAIRRELGIAPEDAQGAVVQTARERARVWLRQGTSFVWNATNITRAVRGQVLDLCAGYGARLHIVYLDAPRDLLLARNCARSHPVPETVIQRLIGKLEAPDLSEAHQVTWIDRA